MHGPVIQSHWLGETEKITGITIFLNFLQWSGYCGVEKHGRADAKTFNSRFEQPCPKRWAKEKAIVKSRWLSDCVKGMYINIFSFRFKTIKKVYLKRSATNYMVETTFLFISLLQWSWHSTFFWLIFFSTMSS